MAEGVVGTQSTGISARKKGIFESKEAFFETRFS